jgi:hypothetical protein
LECTAALADWGRREGERDDTTARKRDDEEGRELDVFDRAGLRGGGLTPVAGERECNRWASVGTDADAGVLLA